MANARTVDIKLKFDPTDMTPGAKGRKFRRDVLLHGGKTDARGFSITDCLLRQDEGENDETHYNQPPPHS